MHTLSDDGVIFEHRFWLQIMGDHARIIFLMLTAAESEYILTAQNFIIQLDELLKQVLQPLPAEALIQLNQNVQSTINRFRDFKSELLRMSVSSDLRSLLPASFYNDMLNELEEYQLILTAITSGQNITFHPLHYHNLWLTDAIGHAAAIVSALDPIERETMLKAHDYELRYNDLFYKAYIMKGYLRSGVINFPSLERLNNEAYMLSTDFMDFLEKLRDQRMDLRVLGSLMPLLADHMARESCYYIWKLSQTIETIRRPDCDPTRPRIEA